MELALEIGSGVKPTQIEGYKVITTDLVKRKGIDYALNANKKFPFEDDTFDMVIAYGVLEHVTDFYFTVNEIHRVLKKGGILRCDMPHFASSQYFWEPDHRRMGHSRMFHAWTDTGDKGTEDMRGMAQNRRFAIVKFDYCINFGTILKPLIKLIGFKNYEYWFARVLPFNIDFLWFDLGKLK